MNKVLNMQVGKSYVDGSNTRVKCIYEMTKGDFPFVCVGEGEGKEELLRRYNKDGVGRGGYPYIKREVLPWEDFEIDEPVMVRHSEYDPWQRRHFAGVSNFGLPKTWDSGRTKWTTLGATSTSWAECRKPTKEELEGN